MRKFVWGAGSLFGVAALVAVIMIVRVQALPSPYLDVPEAGDPGVDSRTVAEHMAEAIRFQTVSFSFESPTKAEAFLALHDWMRATYPRIHTTLELEVVNRYSLLYRWKGTDPDKAPIGLLGHMDVVPVEPGTERNWTHPPFDGVVADGFVWGRGAIDDKSTVILVMEAVERLIAEGFQPDRDIYLAFGHDEEISGRAGAQKIVALLKDRGIMFDWILDEGLAILDGFVDFIDTPMAVVGLAEKGFLTLQLSATDAGGHSSSPRPETAISKIAKAVSTVQASPFPMQVDPADAANLRALGGAMPFMKRLAVANLWAFEGLVMSEFASDPYQAAQYRTTTAATVIRGGTKENVLPQFATAMVNFRLHPRDTIDSVIARTQKLVGPDIKVEVYGQPNNPPAPSDIDGKAYGLFQQALGQSFGPIAMAPSLVVGATDSRFYADVTRETFRFTPVVLTRDQFSGFHGTDERAQVASLGQSVRFYMALIEAATGAGVATAAD